MIAKLGEIIEFPTTLSNKVSRFVELTNVKTDKYLTDSLSNTYFGKKDIYACRGNDFLYLLILCLIGYYEVERINNAGETLDYDTLWVDFNLESTRYYFHEVHNFDIVPLFKTFNLTDEICTSDNLFGTETDYLDLDCLI